MTPRIACLHIAIVWLLTSKSITVSRADNLTSSSSATNRTLIEEPILKQKEVDRLIKKVRIYVYEPPKYLEDFLELEKKCSQMYFHLETELLRLIRRKTGKIGVVVEDPDTADFFWIPHTLHAHEVQTEPYMRKALVPFLNYILHGQPYYNLSGGSDHIFVYVWDNGPVCDTGPVARIYQQDPVFWSIVRPMIFVGYYGMQGFSPLVPMNRRIRKECFKIGHDITLPQYNLFHMRNMLSNWNHTPHVLRRKAARSLANMYYFGDILAEGLYCSRRIRVWMYHYMETCTKVKPPTMDPTINITNLTCTAVRTCSAQHVGLFGLCPAGWGCWSSRLYDAIDRLALPVLLADGMVQPFERWFDYRAFTAKILTGNMVIHDEHHLWDEFHLNGIRFPAMEQLHHDAVSFREACHPCAGDMNETVCLSHPVSRKLVSLAAHRPWFSWDVDAPQNALKLFMLELYCRTPAGREKALCQHSAQPTAHLEYGM